MPAGSNYRIRRAGPDDAEGIAHVLSRVAEERIHSSILEAWTTSEQRSYLASLSAREAFHLAETEAGEIIAYQSLDHYSSILPSMSHVASVGTFVDPAHRGHGVAPALWQATKSFALCTGWKKIVILVRASNRPALAFYQRMGFVVCGRLHDQVLIDGDFDDEILLEHFLTQTP